MVGAVCSGKFGRIGGRSVGGTRTGPAALALLLALTACAPSPTQAGVGSQPAAPSPAQSAPASPPATAGVPGDTDETGPPQAGDRVISADATLDWAWPGPGRPFRRAHQNAVPLAPQPGAPLPALYAIGSGRHPAEAPPYDQLSFRFTGGFPAYDVEFVPELRADGSGLPVPLPGTGAILRVVFRGAQAHTADGASTITSAPAAVIGYQALTSYAPAGDVEGVVTYGIGVGRAVSPAPETKVRIYEVEKISKGQHLYVVAIQLDATAWK